MRALSDTNTITLQDLKNNVQVYCTQTYNTSKALHITGLVFELTLFIINYNQKH